MAGRITRRIARRTGRVPLVLVLLLACTSCKLLSKRGKGAPDASAPAQMPGVATAASAALPAATEEPPAPPTPPPAPPPDPNAMPADDRAALDAAKQQLADVQGLLAHGKDQPKPAESDLKSRCEEIEGVRAKVESRTEPDVKPFVDSSKQVCSFDVPVFSATSALDQMRFSSSQASKLLVCKVAERDIAKARSVKPNHAKVRTLESRFRAHCR